MTPHPQPPHTSRRLPAEWEPQQAVLLALPHRLTDWAYMLDDVLACFRDMAVAISRYAPLIIIAPTAADVDAVLGGAVPSDRYHVVPYTTNDTWARDFGPICVTDGNDTTALDYVFNGWGLKFPACLDNQTTGFMRDAGIIRQYADMRDFVLEGGAIDSDGSGSVLTTSQCLLSPNRNATLSPLQIEQRLCRDFGASRILWLDHGYLAGDDTDSHVDTLARFMPDTPDGHPQIAYTACDRPSDEHYTELSLMEQQLQALRTAEGSQYRLIPLNIPAPIYDEDGQRLPATYANFLFVNGAIFVPVYGDERYDADAIKKIKAALPLYDVVAIDCRALICQHGSLHCMTMQLPLGAVNL